jgi:phage terminase small subunit
MKIVKGLDDKKTQGTFRKDRDALPEVEGIKELPKPANWFNASARAKKIYKEIGTHLLETKKLQVFDSYALVLLAVALEQYSWAVNEINEMNKNRPGSGYVQTYSTGAKNITAEVTVRKEAYKQIIELSSKFGLTIKDRHAMGRHANAAQTELPLFDNYSFDIAQ